MSVVSGLDVASFKMTLTFSEFLLYQSSARATGAAVFHTGPPLAAPPAAAADLHYCIYISYIMCLLSCHNMIYTQFTIMYHLLQLLPLTCIIVYVLFLRWYDSMCARVNQIIMCITYQNIIYIQLLHLLLPLTCIIVCVLYYVYIIIYHTMHIKLDVILYIYIIYHVFIIMS